MPDTPKINGRHDLVTHRILVVSLAAAVLLSGSASVLLAIMGVDTPHSVSALGYTAIGTLSGVLVSVMKGNGHETSV